MSQVIRKFQSGGTVPKTFKYLGNQYNQDEVVKGLLQGIDSEIQRRGMKSDQARTFRDAVVNYLVPGLKNGTITINDDDTLRGEGVISTNGEYNRSGLFKLKKNKTDNNAKSVDATTYLFNYLKSGEAPLYFEKPTPKKSAFNNEDFLTKSISKAWYGGSDIDMNNWFDNRSEQDRLQLLSNIYKNADYNKLYNDYDWSNTNIKSAEDLKNVFLNFSNSIGNSTVDNSDYNHFAALGGNNLKKWLVKPTQNPTQSEDNEEAKLREQAKAEGYDSEEAINAYIENQKLDKQKYEKELIQEVQEKKNELSAEDYFNEYIKSHPFKSTISGYTGYNTTYNPAAVYEFVKKKYGSEDSNALKRYINDIPWVDYLSGKSYPKRVSDNKPVTKEFLTNNLDLAIKNKLLTKVGDNLYVVPNSENYDNWSFIGYNPVTRKYEEMSMLLNEGIRKALAIPEYNKRNSIPVNKQGGILKYQDGGQYSDWNNYWKSKRDKELAIQNQAKESDRTPEEIKAGQRNTSKNLQSEDYARLAGIALDVVSAASAFAPGFGSAISLGTGLASSVSNLYADIADDSVNGGDVVKNLAINLGSDLIGILPGIGGASKIAKITRRILPMAGAITSAWQGLSKGDQYIGSFNKLIQGKDLTVDDWRNLGEGFTLFIGGPGRYAAGHIRNNSYLKNGVSAKPYEAIRSSSGKMLKFKPEIADEIKHAKGLENQNAIVNKYYPGEELPKEFKYGIVSKLKLHSNPEVKKGTDYEGVNWNDADYIPRGFTVKDGKVVPKKGSNYYLSGKLRTDWFANTAPFGYKKNPLKNKSKVNQETSRDDRATRKEFGGILLREGGLIPKYQRSGKLYRDVQSADDLNWGKDVYGSTGYWDTIDNITLENYVQHNDMQNTYPTLGFTNSKPSSMLSVDDRIKKYQDTFNKLTSINSGTMEGLVNSGRITGRGGSSDKAKQWGPDGLGGSITWLRHEGSKDYINNSQLAEINNKLRSRGLEAFFNPLNGMINYRPISSANLITKLPYIETPFSPTVIKNAAQSSQEVNNVARGLEEQPKKSSNISLNPADLLATGRMLGGLATNNKAAKIYKSGLRPNLIDTFENYVPLQGDPYAKALAEKQASNLESIASKTRTSDAALQLAGELDASDKSGNIRFQGGMQDAGMYYKTRMLGQQESDAAKARRVEASNKNSASAKQIDAAKKQIDAARITANYQQVLAPWLAGIEQRFKQNDAIRNQLNMDNLMYSLNTKYNPLIENVLREKQNLLNSYKLANNNSEIGFETSPEGIAIDKKLAKIQEDRNKDYFTERNKLLPKSWLFTNTLAKGGQLTYKEKAKLQSAKDFNSRLAKDSERFHKNVLESKREHNKILKHMSSLTAQLIKQAMS